MVAQVSTGSVPLAYAYTAQGGSGRLSVPVSPAMLLYANFAHVAGVAASDGSAAASIDTLQILNTLIDRLSSMKNQPLAAREAPEDLQPERIDALIEQYASELHSIVQARAAQPYAAPKAAAASQAGMLFTLAA